MSCVESSSTAVPLPPLLLQNISSLNNCKLMLLFLHSLSSFLSLPCWLLPFSFLCVCSHLQRLWSKIISIENPPSTNSMVQSTSSLTLPSLVWSLHDVLHAACHLLTRLSKFSPLFSEACTHLMNSVDPHA